MSENTTLNQLTLFAEDSPANHSANLEKGKVSRTNGHYGKNTPVLLANLSPDGSWAKTWQGYSQLTMDGTLVEYSETWQDWGMMRNGAIYQHLISEHCIDVKEFTLWPTPTAAKGSDGERPYTFLKRAHKMGGHGLTLAIACALAPNPGDIPSFISYNPSMHNYKDFEYCPRGRTNPEFAEWLMGFPIGWTDIAD